MANGAGKKVWILPDCELPPEGEGVLKGHESVVIVNDSNKKAVIKVKLYFSDRECYDNITWEVPVHRHQGPGGQCLCGLYADRIIGGKKNCVRRLTELISAG